MQCSPGIVVGLSKHPPEALHDVTFKPILDRLDSHPLMSLSHIELAHRLSQHYMTPLGACLWLMLPPGITGASRRFVYLLDEAFEPEDRAQRLIVERLREEGNLTTFQLEKTVARRKLTRLLNRLEEDGVIEQASGLQAPSVSQQMVVMVTPAFQPYEADQTLDLLRGNAHKQRRIVAYMAGREAAVPYPRLRRDTDATLSEVRRLEEMGILHCEEQVAYTDPLADREFVPIAAPRLTDDQYGLWIHIRHALHQAGEIDSRQRKFLLHGVTGSGKTELYLKSIAETLEQGRQAVFLVPEIALTPQTIQRVASRFPEQTAVVHGSLSQRERYDTWDRARRGEVSVVVGTRSALFTPLPDLGLIILDEEHDPSYKHTPPLGAPYYHARTVAEMLVETNGATLLLGSATPDISSMYRSRQGELTYLHLPQRIMGHPSVIRRQAQRAGVVSRYQPQRVGDASAAAVVDVAARAPSDRDDDDVMTIELPPVSVVDMRSELKAGNTSIFSRALHERIGHVLAHQQQAILLLNRRGQASYVFCRDCGYHVTCERCDMPMTHHGTIDLMRCHHCGNAQSVPLICPECSSSRIRFFGAGTQTVEQQLARQFPDARVLRWDADTVQAPEQHEALLASFIDHEADILVGTQMIAKGLDIPMVTLVGVVNADPGLNLPDFRASERGFQLLTQVAGRAGRGVLGGEVILQTYMPHHPAIVYAAEHDYLGFYQQEIRARRELGYPPFRHMARVLVQGPNRAEVEGEARRLADLLSQRIRETQHGSAWLIGPAPCFFERIDSRYRWQVIVRAIEPRPLLDGLGNRPGVHVDPYPLDFL